MVNSNQEFSCPHCEETFVKSEAAWTVCLDCGEIFPPGEDWTKHGPGLRKGTENTKKVWPCNHGLNVYTEEDAKQKQKEIREDGYQN